MAADRHYASDTLVGAALGAAAGFMLPWLVHYRGVASTPRDDATLRWTLTSVRFGNGAGLGVYAWF